MECSKGFIALSDGIKCQQLSCSILGLCYDLLLTWGEMRHLASVTWLVSSGVGSDPGSFPVGIVLWPLPGSSGDQDLSLCS